MILGLSCQMRWYWALNTLPPDRASIQVARSAAVEMTAPAEKAKEWFTSV
jgi:hypothetical protein